MGFLSTGVISSDYPTVTYLSFNCAIQGYNDTTIEDCDEINSKCRAPI